MLGFSPSSQNKPLVSYGSTIFSEEMRCDTHLVRLLLFKVSKSCYCLCFCRVHDEYWVQVFDVIRGRVLERATRRGVTGQGVVRIIRISPFSPGRGEVAIRIGLVNPLQPCPV